MPREPHTLTESRVREIIEDAIRARLRAGFSRNLIDLLAVSAPIVILNPGSAGASIGLAFDDAFFSVDGSGQLTFDGDAIVTALSDLSDVDTTGVTDGQILFYNNTAGEWQPNDLPTIPSNISDLSDVDATGATHGQFLFYNQGDAEWQPISPPPIPAELSDLNDVHDAAPSDNDVLTWNDGESRWEPAAPTGGGASELNDLSDVDTANVTDGQILMFNNAAGEWQPDDLPTIPANLSDLNDVGISSPIIGERLTYNGTEWVNGTPPMRARVERGGTDQTNVGPTEIVEYNTVITDPYNLWNQMAFRFEIERDGVYIVNAGIAGHNWGAAGIEEEVLVRVLKNGSTHPDDIVLAGPRQIVGRDGTREATATGILSLQAGDWIQAWAVMLATTAPVDIRPQPSTWFELALIQDLNETT